jgi:hypothetical protein
MPSSLESATALAEELLLGATADPRADRQALARYAAHLGGDGPTAGSAAQLVHLSKLLHALDLVPESWAALRIALHQMELAEGGPEPVDALVWNDAGSLLVLHDRLADARHALVVAVGKTKDATAPFRARVRANLASTLLRSGHVDDALTWAGRAEDALGAPDAAGREGEEQSSVRLLTAWIRATAAADGTAGEEVSVGRFAAAIKQFTQVAGDDHLLSLEAAFDLAVTSLRRADTTGDRGQAARAKEALEVLALRASTVLGPEDPRVLAISAVLAGVEYDVPGDDGDARRRHALATLGRIAGRTSAVLGVDHPQTLATLDSLARMPAELSPSLELPYHIDRFYLPREGERRNEDKKDALRRESSLVRIIAHAGASYLLSDVRRFQPTIKEALERHVHFEIIISNPWNSLGIFINRESPQEIEVTAENIVDHIRASRYYRETFGSVTKEYQALRAVYGDAIELRLTPMDIPATTLLTSDVGFYEPYVTTDPEYRTNHGMQTFEVRFSRATRLYEDNLSGFATQWRLASDLDRFRTFEAQYQSRLRLLMSTLTEDRK